jgi:hypothetical protein
MERLLNDCWPELPPGASAAAPLWGLDDADAAAAHAASCDFFLSALMPPLHAAVDGSEGTTHAAGGGGGGECSGGGGEVASPASPPRCDDVAAAGASACGYRCLDRNHAPDCARCTAPPSAEDGVLFFLRGSKGARMRRCFPWRVRGASPAAAGPMRAPTNVPPVQRTPRRAALACRACDCRAARWVRRAPARGVCRLAAPWRRAARPCARRVVTCCRSAANACACAAGPTAARPTAAARRAAPPRAALPRRTPRLRPLRASRGRGCTAASAAARARAHR